MSLENVTFVSQLTLLRKKREQAETDSAAKLALREDRRKFVNAIREPLRLTALGAIVIGRLATTSPAKPISTAKLTDHIARMNNVNGATVGLTQGISDLNNIMPEEVKLKIYQVKNDNNCPGEYWYLGPTMKSVLTEEDQVKALSLAALGVKQKMIADQMGKPMWAIKKIFAKIHKTLGVSNQLEAVVMLINQGKLDPAKLTEGFDLSLFEGLNPAQILVTQALLKKEELSKYSKSQVISRLSEVYDILGFEESEHSRVRVAVLYLASQQQKQENFALKS